MNRTELALATIAAGAIAVTLATVENTGRNSTTRAATHAEEARRVAAFIQSEHMPPMRLLCTSELPQTNGRELVDRAEALARGEMRPHDNIAVCDNVDYAVAKGMTHDPVVGCILEREPKFPPAPPEVVVAECRN